MIEKMPEYVQRRLMQPYTGDVEDAVERAHLFSTYGFPMESARWYLIVGQAL